MSRKQERIRLQNLEYLIREAGSLAELARATGSNSSYLSQVRNQTKAPSGSPRRVGDELAEMLERGTGKPEGWMDEPHGPQAESETPQSPYGEAPVRTLCPLLSWVQAGEWTETSKEYLPEYDTELYPCPVHCSRRTFVLQVRGISMEPKFSEGDLIFVDPEVEADHGKYVVVLLEGSDETTFKQLVIEGERNFLKALNPDWPERLIEVNSNAQICGVVVFKGEVI